MGLNQVLLIPTIESNNNDSSIVPLTYYLIDNFTDTDAAPIALPRTADVEGGETGSDTSSLLSVSGGVLNAAADAGTPTVYLYDAQRAREAGLCFMITIDPLVNASTLAWLYGWNDTNSNQPVRLGFILQGIGVFRLFVNNTFFSWSLAGSLANNAPEILAIVQYSNRNEFLRYVDGVGWRLAWVDYSYLDSNLYAGHGRVGAAAIAHTQSAYRVVPLGASGSLLYAEQTGSLAVNDTLQARNGNQFVTVKVATRTTTTNMTIKVRSVDSSNYLLIDIASDGTIKLFENTGSGETQRIASAVGAVGASNVDVRLALEGANGYLYAGNQQVGTYGSLVNTTATEIEVTAEGDGAFEDLRVYDRVAATAQDALYDQVNAGLG